MAPDTRGFVGLFGPPRNTLHSKWDALFDKDAKEWIAFKPALGLHVYPCYSCRHMFYSKKSFQDHINRRAVVLRYKCPGCQNEDLTFYNRCSFQLHCRKHYNLEKGTIHLNNMQISSLPLGLAGFSKHVDIPYLFDVEEEYIEGNTFMNAQFYAPKIEERGKEIITLTPSHLVINRTDQNGENQALALKQVTINIPKCQFITLQCLRELRLQMQGSDDEVDGQMDVKIEPEDIIPEGQEVSEYKLQDKERQDKERLIKELKRKLNDIKTLLSSNKDVVDMPNISMHQAIKKKLFSHDKIQVKKRKLADQQKKTIKDLLDEKRTDSDNMEKDLLKENKKPMKLSSVNDAIESVISRQDKPTESHEVSESRVEVLRKEENNRAGDQPLLLMEVETISEPAKVEIVKLPENLPRDILEIIENIKKSARDYKDGGNVKFFTGEVNAMLLNLERKCKVLGKSSRVKVYEHLAPFVRCRKETLIKRAKNLVIEDEHKKLLKRTIEKLTIQVDQLMPSLIINHDKECQRILQKKFSQEAAINEELKNLKDPRRRFPLTEDMRRMIRDIVSFKKICLLHEGKQKDALEDLLTEYLKKDILVLWPEGWMSMVILKKFCTTTAIKTPDPKSLSSNINSNKHSHKPHASSTSTIIKLNSGNNLTITPVNLTEKLSEVSNNNVKPTSQLDTIIKPIKEKVIEKQHETIIKPINKEIVVDKLDTIVKSDKQKESKDNGVIVINTSKPKEDPVIQKAAHCQVIDLTDNPQLLISKSTNDNSHFSKNHTETKSNTNFENALKNKFTGISVTTTNTHDRDDVQMVMESLKALQKLSSPSKNETSSPVSVIAFNKNYSNSNSSHATSGVSNERTNFSGAIGFQDEFQKQFIGSLNSHKSSSPPSKPSYNRCS